MKKLYVNPLSAKKVKVRASPSGFAVPYVRRYKHRNGNKISLIRKYLSRIVKQHYSR